MGTLQWGLEQIFSGLSRQYKNVLDSLAGVKHSKFMLPLLLK
jgi:hypothetical protein